MDDWQDWVDILNNADVETAKLIVELQLADIQDLRHTPSRSTNRTDAILARRLYEAELAQLRTDLPNRQLGEELEDDDNDRQELYETAAFGWHLNQWEETIEHEPEPAPPPPRPRPVQLIACVACSDDIHPNDIVQVPCGHHYCRDCLENLYNSCMTDETLFPPRCCHQEFPWNVVKAYLTQKCRSKFGAKRVELETQDRTYCHVSACSAFIRPVHIMGRLASCPRRECGLNTCTLCKGRYHIGFCPRDTTMDALLGAAARNGWQKCYVCRRIIELKTGCNHMTCICRAQFCYVCGAGWKTCDCPQWDEDRLIERAEQYVENDQAPVPHRGANRAQQVANAAEHLRDNHECQHEHFRNYNRPRRMMECELCGVEYEHWIKQCTQCWSLICNTCRRNRL